MQITSNYRHSRVCAAFQVILHTNLNCNFRKSFPRILKIYLKLKLDSCDLKILVLKYFENINYYNLKFMLI